MESVQQSTKGLSVVMRMPRAWNRGDTAARNTVSTARTGRFQNPAMSHHKSSGKSAAPTMEPMRTPSSVLPKIPVKKAMIQAMSGPLE